ncbi:uncharacterized protein LOC134241759 [Saccostrea cucullata]|uniref:uncharacterized protein LOC134241759 n=1 Tax=Saccostrea cuccullata TaxID=36930 RepID=UPI002ED44246
MILRIIRVPELDVYPISTSKLNLTCLAAGNPAPTDEDYKWTFQPFHSNTTIEKNSNGKFLLFQSLQEADSGTYTCSVTNTLNSTHSLNVTIIVNGTIPEPKPSLHCHSNPCGALENCVETGHEYKCETNTMSVVGVLFIVLTIASLSVSFGLAYYLRKLHKVSQIGVQNSKISNDNATTLPMTETTGDLNTRNGTVPSNETNDAVYAQIKKP